MTELERRLVAAGAHYPFPETPDVAAAARARLPRSRPRGRARFALAAGVVVAAVAAGVLALSPAARSAIVDLLDRVPGIEINRVDRLPVAAYDSAPYFGLAVDPAEAKQRFGRPLRLPDGIGEPDHLYWLQYPPGDMITAVYGGDDRRARLVFSQWKTGGPALFYKTLTYDTAVDPITVDGGPGLWMSRGPHIVWYLSPDDRDDPAGAMHWQSIAHLAGNVLAWRRGDVIYRLEADVPKAKALELARSLEER